ncbi:2-amino-4-hydroxy-6-hydroxymethyldihydropteridine diphosphokinase [Salinithrix halophila]|uniref:2-amino-4-hydroxy-6-hydroxymethyldihydropteridine diphosphokinase n=1 Tax=Salinithrix halophila TaxID=1485204 RepID=A0ABV8JAB9_9BACL
MRSQVTAYIGLGTNLGDRLANLKEALDRLDARQGIEVTRISSIYETDPIGFADQPDFLNMCAELVTDLSPEELLDALLGVEQELFRVRTVRWGPRTIDLDLLLYGEQVFKGDQLTIPHPRMTERAFVLVPLADLAPDAVVPPTGKTVAQLAEELEDDGEIRRAASQLEWGNSREISPLNGMIN